MLFDHDVQIFAGASGAPMINLSGEIVGIQCFEVSYTVHGYYIPSNHQNAEYRYAYDFKAEDKDKLPHLEIVPLKFIHSNIKQAIAVEYIDKVFRRFFKNEQASEDCDLNEFISGLFKQRIENNFQKLLRAEDNFRTILMNRSTTSKITIKVKLKF
jgi:hypothetical protein